MIFDTHLHLVDRGRISYPWLGDAPALNRDWSYEDYEKTARRIGISDVLHMEVDVAPGDIDAEIAMVAGLMARPGSLIRGAIAGARPEEGDFIPWLEKIDRNVVKGLRRVLHVVPDDISQKPLFRENVARLGAVGLPFDLCMLARQKSLAVALIDACPDTVFILDHCGVPDIEGDGFRSWAEGITDLARRPNVNAKISGITAYTGGNWTLEGLRPYIETVIGAFGWDRVVWGSDSPVCTLHSSLNQWVALSRAVLEGCSETERARLYQLNARRIWGIVS
ncbi:MAG: amidohydrolase family protein [Pseudorhodobacter sp.]